VAVHAASRRDRSTGRSGRLLMVCLLVMPTTKPRDIKPVLLRVPVMMMRFHFACASGRHRAFASGQTTLLDGTRNRTVRLPRRGPVASLLRPHSGRCSTPLRAPSLPIGGRLVAPDLGYKLLSFRKVTCAVVPREARLASGLQPIRCSSVFRELCNRKRLLALSASLLHDGHRSTSYQVGPRSPAGDTARGALILARNARAMVA